MFFLTLWIFIFLLSSHPTPLPGKDVKMICFLNGYPNDKDLNGFQGRGMIESQALKLCVSLCPERFPKVMVIVK